MTNHSTRVSLFAMVLFALLLGASRAAYAQHQTPLGECVADTGTTDGVYTAETWPCELTKRPITLAKGMAEVRASMGINLSTDQVGKPTTLTPAVYYGVSDKLSIGLNSDTLCLSGSDGGCAKAFNSAGADAIFAFTQGSTNIAAHGGLELSSFDPGLTALNIGMLGRLTFGKIAVVLDPQIQIGLNKRTIEDHRESLFVPVNIWFQASPKLAVGIDTGISAPELGHVGDFYAVPIGLDVLFAVSNKLDVGYRFGFDDIGGAPKPVSATDARSMTLRVNFRL